MARLHVSGRYPCLTGSQGQAVTIEAITDYVIVSTPFASSHVKRLTLAEMQKQGLISSPNQTRKNTYPDGTIIVFPPIQARRTP
jgi:hypothetical protein